MPIAKFPGANSWERWYNAQFTAHARKLLKADLWERSPFHQRRAIEKALGIKVKHETVGGILKEFGNFDEGNAASRLGWSFFGRDATTRAIGVGSPSLSLKLSGKLDKVSRSDPEFLRARSSLLLIHESGEQIAKGLKWRIWDRGDKVRDFIKKRYPITEGLGALRKANRLLQSLYKKTRSITAGSTSTMGHASRNVLDLEAYALGVLHPKLGPEYSRNWLNSRQFDEKWTHTFGEAAFVPGELSKQNIEFNQRYIRHINRGNNIRIKGHHSGWANKQTEAAIGSDFTAGMSYTGFRGGLIASAIMASLIFGGSARAETPYGLNEQTAAKLTQMQSAAKKAGITFKVTEGYRSQSRQDTLYAQGRTAPGKVVTKAKVSKHTSGAAFDVAVLRDGKVTWDPKDYQKIGAIGRSAGLEWGGDWKMIDMPHFQLAQETAKAQVEGIGKRSHKDVINAIVGEAGDQGYEGMLALSGSIRERAKVPLYKDDPLKGVYGLTAKQLPNEPKSVFDLAEKAWEESKKKNIVGAGAYVWGSPDDIKKFEKTKWFRNMEKTVTVGEHTFFRETQQFVNKNVDFSKRVSSVMVKQGTTLSKGGTGTSKAMKFLQKILPR